MGTILISIGISRLIQPVLYDRYLFPMAAIAWILLARGCSNLRFAERTLWGGLLLGIMVFQSVTWMPALMRYYQDTENRAEAFLTYVSDTFDEDTELLNTCDIAASYYLEGYRVADIEPEELTLDRTDQERTYYLTVPKDKNEEYEALMEKNGIHVECVGRDYFLSIAWFSLYRIKPENR